ncbi:MAG TPA: ABC transporter substrate-binding protein [Beijerinckiaceae bacterium]|nr:ABC transporter substrate-binding protein [Beijerinckiaceae bacterium]
MRRREFIVGIASAAVSAHGATAQTPSRVYRIGLFSTAAPLGNDSEQGAAFLRGMKQAGYVLGQNLAVERRGARGRVEQLPALAQELIAAGADVLVVNGYRTALAAKATGHPTVVAAGIGDAVVTGLVESLARPGGNITGISESAAELSTKRLGLLKELVPGLRQVAMLWNQDDLGMTLRYRASAQAAESLGVRVQTLGVREPDDFEAAFAAMNADTPDAILMVADTLTNLNRKRVFDYAVERRLPAIYELAFLVRDGGLMSYGPDLRELYERAAALVDRILRGEKPADLPFEQPTRYLFAINLKTAKAIGLEVPPLLLARADEVIE